MIYKSCVYVHSEVRYDFRVRDFVDDSYLQMASVTLRMVCIVVSTLGAIKGAKIKSNYFRPVPRVSQSSQRTPHNTSDMKPSEAESSFSHSEFMTPKELSFENHSFFTLVKSPSDLSKRLVWCYEQCPGGLSMGLFKCFLFLRFTRKIEKSKWPRTYETP